MARYIDADAFLKKIERFSLSNGTTLGKHSGVADEIIDILIAEPTADVVPRAEVESILDGLMKEAREIANHYEKSANETIDYDYARIEYRGCEMGALLVLFKIAELKKKYIGDKQRKEDEGNENNKSMCSRQ